MLSLDVSHASSTLILLPTLNIATYSCVEQFSWKLEGNLKFIHMRTRGEKQLRAVSARCVSQI